MSQLDTADAPRKWIRFSNEPAFDPETYYASDSDAEMADEANERLIRLTSIALGIVAAVLAVLTVTSCAGYSLGPGSGQTVMCEAAGGHMVDRAIVHRCAP